MAQTYLKSANVANTFPGLPMIERVKDIKLKRAKAVVAIPKRIYVIDGMKIMAYSKEQAQQMAAKLFR